MNRVVRRYYAFQFFFSLLLWVPIFYEFQKRIGLSDPEIFRIQSIYYVAFCLLEIPTGFAADRWGYLLCMRLGAIGLVAANLLPILAPNYAGLLWHFLLVAAARSFISGASSAYLYEYLLKRGDVAAYKQAEGNARAYGLVGKVVCWAGVGALMQWHLFLPYWLTALSALISVVFAWMLPEFSKKTLDAISAESPSLASRLDLRAVGRLMANTPAMVLVMIQGIGIFVLARICQVNLFQPILGEKGFGLAAYGLVMSVTTIFEAAGSAYPGWMRRWFNDLNSVFILTVAMAASLSFVAISGRVGTWIGLSVFSLATGLSFPIQRQLLNDTIPDSRYRATLLSVESIIDRATCAWVASLLARYVATGRTDSFLHLSAGVTLAGMAVLFVTLRFSVFRLRAKPVRSSL